MPFPGTITPLLRFDPTQQAYQDLAQTTPANAGDPVRALMQPSPLTGAWLASASDANALQRVDGTTLSCEPLAPDFPAHATQYLTAPAVSVPVNGSTIAIAFRAFATYGAPPQALLSYGNQWGLLLTGSGLALAYNGGAQWGPGLTIGKDVNPTTLDADNGAGNLVVIVARWTPTGLDIYVDEEGTVTSASTSVSVSSGTISGPLLGYTGIGFGNMLIGQACIVGSAISDSDRSALVAYMKSAGVAPSFPIDREFVGINGDSIAQGFGASAPGSWASKMLGTLRSTYPRVRMLNAAIVGSGVTPTAGNNSIQYKTVSRHIDPLRGGNVVVLAAMTNEIVSDPSDANVDAKLAAQYTLADAYRALGAKVAIANPLPRSGLLGTCTQSQFNHARARVCASLDANVRVRFDSLVDCRTIVGMGQDGDSSSSNYTVDQVHPSPAGYALLAPVYTAAVLDLLSHSPIPNTQGGQEMMIAQILDWDSDPNIYLFR